MVVALLFRRHGSRQFYALIIVIAGFHTVAEYRYVIRHMVKAARPLRYCLVIMAR